MLINTILTNKMKVKTNIAYQKDYKDGSFEQPFTIVKPTPYKEWSQNIRDFQKETDIGQYQATYLSRIISAVNFSDPHMTSL